MPITIKVVFTIATFCFSVVICLIRTGKNSAGPDWGWRFGKKDLVRKMLFNNDGSAKRYMKVSVLTIFAIFLFSIWWIVPTQPPTH